jgi:CRISPR-associated protein Cas2
MFVLVSYDVATSKDGGEIDPKEDSLRFYFLGSNWRHRVEHVGAKKTVDQEGPLIV